MIGQLTTKTPISIRMNDDLLEMLEKVSGQEGSMFWQRDRTWLIEYAIEQTYGDMLVTADKENGKPPN